MMALLVAWIAHTCCLRGGMSKVVSRFADFSVLAQSFHIARRLLVCPRMHKGLLLENVPILNIGKLLYLPFTNFWLFFFSEAVSENGNLEDLFKQFASLMPLRGYKLLQVIFMKTLLIFICLSVVFM